MPTSGTRRWKERNSTEQTWALPSCERRTSATRICRAWTFLPRSCRLVTRRRNQAPSAGARPWLNTLVREGDHGKSGLRVLASREVRKKTTLASTSTKLDLPGLRERVLGVVRSLLQD